MLALSSELCAWIVPGLAGTIASVDREQQPQMARVWAARPRQERDVVEVYVLRSAAPALLEGVVSSGRAALNLIEVSSYRSRLFTGPCRLSTTGVESAFLGESLAALNRAFHAVGMAPDAAQRMLSHGAAPPEMLALVLSVECVFDQSPKRGAGGRL